MLAYWATFRLSTIPRKFATPAIDAFGKGIYRGRAPNGLRSWLPPGEKMTAREDLIKYMPVDSFLRAPDQFARRKKITHRPGDML